MIAAIANILGKVIRLIYNLVGQNYGLSIILFTILTKIILFPLYLSQVKSTEKLNKIAPQDKKIREKYKNDNQKMAEELNKLYAQNQINPMGGCLPMLIQIPLILAMLYIVRQPLTYMVQMPQEQITQYAQQLLNKEDVTKAEISNNEILISNKFNLINMKSFGIDFGDVPSNVFNKDVDKKANPLSLLIPILTVVFSIIQIKQSQKNTTMTEEQIEMQKSTNLMMPLFSGMIAYTMPLALGIYWLLSSILQIVQQYGINLIIKSDEGKLEISGKTDIKKLSKKNK